MASALWQGNWRTRARIISGLVLFTYVLLHFLNIGLGLFSLELMERASDWRRVVSRSMVGTVLLYGALLTHLGLALYRLARRRTLRMPMTEMLQIALGLTIPFFLMAHFVHTRVAASAYDVNDRMGYIAGLTAPKGRTMGHAGAIVSAAGESAEEKVEILRQCGVTAVERPSEFGSTVRTVLAKIS